MVLAVQPELQVDLQPGVIVWLDQAKLMRSLKVECWGRPDPTLKARPFLFLAHAEGVSRWLPLSTSYGQFWLEPEDYLYGDARPGWVGFSFQYRGQLEEVLKARPHWQPTVSCLRPEVLGKVERHRSNLAKRLAYP